MKNGELSGDPLTIQYASYAADSGKLGGATPNSFVNTTGDQAIQGIKTFNTPFEITSSSLIANLNADKVDGADLETASITNSNTKIPSSKLVRTGLAGKADVNHTHAFSSITSPPTTLAGYGITNAVDTSTKQSIGGIKTFTAASTLVNGQLTVGSGSGT